MHSDQLLRRRVPTARPVWSTRRQALALFARGATVRVAGGVGLVVGTILSVTNQGSAWIHRRGIRGSVGAILIWSSP